MGSLSEHLGAERGKAVPKQAGRFHFARIDIGSRAAQLTRVRAGLLDAPLQITLLVCAGTSHNVCQLVRDPYEQLRSAQPP